MSFAGGGTDFQAFYQDHIGAVVTTGINKYIYITVNKKFDDLIRVSYSKTEIVSNVEDIEHNIIREALKLVGVDKGIEIVYMGDIPLGTAGIGLGSSGSLAVGVLNALYAYIGKHVSAEKLALDACKIEIDVLSQPIGKQDQYIAAYGGFNHLQFNSDDTVFVNPIICSSSFKEQINRKVLLFYTGLTRKSSEVLEEQNNKTEKNLDCLMKIKQLAADLKSSLIEEDLSSFGEILHQGWLLKRGLASKVSNSLIDDYYEKALKAGSIGGKILGAGGGGFLLLCCENKKQEAVRSAICDLKEVPFFFEPQGSKIIYVHD